MKTQDIGTQLKRWGITFPRAMVMCAMVLVVIELKACNAVPSLSADNLWRIIHFEGESDKHAGLRIEVTPSREISILIDHNKVATASPYEIWDLPPGEHTLTVRAMGYHSMDLPLTLAGGETLHIPVTLRAR